MLEVSILILTKNQEWVIAETLNGVFSQETTSNFEVIVIDSGSKDRTIDRIREYPINLVQIPSSEFGHGKTRNLGVKLAKGEYIVFLNGDATPKNKYWLESLINNFFLYDKIAGIYSRIYPRNNCNPLDERDILTDDYLFGEKVKYINSFPEYHKIDIKRKRKFISFHTVSCAIKKGLLLDNLFADIEFGEDLEWSKRMLEKGFRIIFEPRSEVIHSHNLHSSFFRTFKRYFDDARANQQILKRWNLLSLLELPVVIFLKFIKDILYILKLENPFFYKIKWISHSPFLRLGEFFGILLGIFPYWPEKVIDRLSLVREIKSR